MLCFGFVEALLVRALCFDQEVDTTVKFNNQHRYKLRTQNEVGLVVPLWEVFDESIMFL